MAFQDILDAIIAQSDKQIEQARSAHQKTLTSLKEQSAQRTAGRKQDIAVQTDAKKKQLEAKAQAHGHMMNRNAVLRAKQTSIDSLYDDVLAKLLTLPEDKLKTLLEACLGKLPKEGTLMPSKQHEAAIKKIAGGMTMGDSIDAQGGFIFVTDKQEYNFTFEHLVQTSLRPATEIEVAHSLFR